MSEMVATTAILSIVLAGLTGAFVSASRGEIDLNTRFQAQETARLAFEKLRREIHCASAINYPTDSPYSSATLSGDPDGAGVTRYPAVAVTLGTWCPTGSSSATTYAAWCVRASGTKYALWRTTSSSPVAACPGSGGVRWADNLTSAYPFTSTAASASSLGKLSVWLQVNADAGTGVRTYRLFDHIVLRNTVRQ